MIFEAQKTRLRKILDATKSTPESLSIEKMILYIDSKIIHSYAKMSSTEIRLHRRGIAFLNQHMKREKKAKQYLGLFDTAVVSEKTKQKIDRILKEDKERL